MSAIRNLSYMSINMKQLCSSDKKCVFIDNMCLHEDALQLIDNKFDCLHFAKTIPASAFPHHLQYLKKRV